MKAIELVVNELSWKPAASSRDEAQEWMLAISNVVGAAMDRGWASALLCSQVFLEGELSHGYPFLEWATDPSVDQVVKQLVQTWLSWGRLVEDCQAAEGCLTPVFHDSRPGYGLTLAAKRGDAVVSAPRAPWTSPSDSVTVACGSGSMEVVNFHSTDSIARRLRWISSRCCLKPRYVNPGTHELGSPLFRGGGSMTSPLPHDAESVYDDAIPTEEHDGTSNWWGRGVGGLYRYQPSWIGSELMAHWNGATADGGARAIRLDDVPIHVRRFFGE